MLKYYYEQNRFFVFYFQAHFVCYNMKYGSLKEAQDKPDGLCVMATLFRVSTRRLMWKIWYDIGNK
jgi:hypothetical protein